MHKKLFKILVQLSLFIGLSSASAQYAANQYGLKVINSLAHYKKTVEADAQQALVKIKDYVPNIMLDIKYATNQNVFYTQLYKIPAALVRLPVAKALASVQEDLNKQGLSLKIYDAYRPYSVTCQMYEILPDTLYMGLPWQGSKHNRGIALDLTVVDLKTKQELRMPTPFDALVYASHPDFMKLPTKVIENRELLKSAMKKHGFKVDPVEWWHFNYVSTTTFELLDIPFEALE